ncbi:hypothetical protein EYC80_010129 [Monilinia laxa]|uniref:Aquaporin n=1 Tax=Monilinia laxa TaxID=61186 RepID=A0A5N6JLY2_MONLA|nr:hypothetical protein EYC80_010129 [Monilinia laxa]
MGVSKISEPTLPASEESEKPPTEETQLIPASCAQFPGSFAPDLRKDKRKVSKRGGLTDRFYIFLTDGWNDVTVWKSAFIEFVGTACLCYLSAFVSIAIHNSDTTQVAAYERHLQEGLIRGSLGEQRTLRYDGGGCLLETTSVSEGQAYLIESVLSCIMLIVSFGTALDPRQAQLFGPRLGPFMVACTLGIVSFSSINLAPGYPGAGLNPARCFAFAVARGNFAYQWIWWFGPVTGAIIHSSVYHFAPPYHREKGK